MAAVSSGVAPDASGASMAWAETLVAATVSPVGFTVSLMSVAASWAEAFASLTRLLTDSDASLKASRASCAGCFRSFVTFSREALTLLAASLIWSFRLLISPRSTSRWISDLTRSEEHTSELQSLMRISYAVFCLKKKKQEYERYKH